MDQDFKRLEELVLEARREWARENLGSAETIKERVKQTLDNQEQGIIAKLVGFNNHFGRWEVDHCNGRSGETLVGDFFKTIASEAVAAWLLEQAGKLPRLPGGAIKALRAEYLEAYKRVLLKKVIELAEVNAQKDAEEVIKRVLGKTEETNAERSD